MKTLEALEVIEVLADGVNPFTGEVFAEDSPYQNPKVIRALHKAIEALSKKKQKKNRPALAGSKWSDEESQLLAREFDSGMPIHKIAGKHQRTKVAIAARLVRIGKAASRDEVLMSGKYQ